MKLERKGEKRACLTVNDTVEVWIVLCVSIKFCI